jgi:hypothetical protein
MLTVRVIHHRPVAASSRYASIVERPPRQSRFVLNGIDILYRVEAVHSHIIAL